MSLKLKSFVNPYDYANPVNEEKYFIGRGSEKSDIVYYLGHARSTRKPIHLALIGPRASGKTSLLNIVGIEAKRRDFCVVRVNLNEGDVSSELYFFKKLFRAILNAAFFDGAFGGKAGEIFKAFNDLVATGNCEDVSVIPFIFPVQSARAVTGDFFVADDLIEEDLISIYKELGKPIVILMDECDTLRANRVIVEKVRNIFMNMQGYMLVLAATENFFPVMDEVFSPIMRQFKKIEVGPFKDTDDVVDCVKGPLRQIGLGYKQIRDLVSSSFISDIDILSARRPYEIQLICHTVFKRCQMGVATKFTLDLKTLENIQAQLASGADLEARGIIKSARSLTRKNFALLDAVTGCKDNICLGDLYRIEYLYNGTNHWSQSDFARSFHELVSLGLISEESGGVKFSGDDFDRLFIKYIAKQKSAVVYSSPVVFEALIYRKCVQYLSRFSGAKALSAIQISDDMDDIENLIKFISGDMGKEGSEEIKLSPFAENFLCAIMSFKEGVAISLYEICVSSNIGSSQFWFLWTSPEKASETMKFEGALDGLKSRGSDMEINVRLRSWNILVPSQSDVVGKIEAIDNDQLKARVSFYLMAMIPKIYVDDCNKEKARAFAESALRLSCDFVSPYANNIGYMCMIQRKYEEAEKWFMGGLEYSDDTEVQLIHYNLGVLYLMQEKAESAASHFRAARDTLFPDDASCIVRVTLDDADEIEFTETSDPPALRVLALEALDVMQRKFGSSLVPESCALI